MSNEEKAIGLIAQAEKKVKSSQGFLGGLFGWVMISQWNWYILCNDELFEIFPRVIRFYTF